MKKAIITFTCLVLIAASSFAALPNEKVLKIFNATFNSARNVKWSDHSDYYEVSFVQSQIRTKVVYDLDGNFLSAIRYYTGQMLPANVLCQLRNKYPDKAIFGITEFTSREEVNYFVKLQDKKSWTTVKVKSNGEMEVVEKYKKA